MTRKSCDSVVSQPPPADLTSPGPPMYVVNRKGEREAVLFDKILTRIEKLSFGLHPLVDPATVAKNVIKGMFPGIKTTELDDLAAQTCAYMAGTHPDFSRLAARIAISNLHKNTSDSFQEVVRQLRNCTDVLGNPAPLIAADVYSFIMEVGDTLDDAIDFSRDFEYDYFAFKTLERSYLLRVDNKIVERPQHMLMRVACGIHCGSLPSVLETYRLLSQRYFTHATPTLFNAGTPNPQMSSCFLLTIKDDSINGIYDTLKDCALISKTAGGIGLAIHKIRATGSYISGTNGRSNGIVPMLKVFNATARYVDQGGGKRKGSFAIYLEPWHADIMEFLDLRKNHGSEDLRARDLFYALWIPDLFMKRVKNDEEWSLFCPHEAPGLADCWGKEFEALYHQYEAEGRARTAVRAQTLWFSILQSQIETGTPYMLYKDACNRKSNQQNLGTIQCSNLCTEIVEYTAPDEIAVCNLASLALPNFVTAATPENYAHNADPCVVNEGHVTSASDVNNNNEASASDVNNNNEASACAEEQWCNGIDSDDIENGNLCFDYKALYRVTKVVARNLNRIVDRNQYPVPEARRSNLRHRPIGIGVQGLADVLQLLRLPYDSSEARKVNRLVFETIYYAAVETSVELAQQDGPYSTYEGSPASKGLFQFDLWNQERAERGLPPVLLSGMWDWEALRQKMKQYGLRNSLLVAPMPTASTSQLLGNNESFEPYTSNIYCRRVLSGEFFVVNPHLLRDLLRLNLWNERLRQTLIAANGSVQSIPEIPASLKALYKTVWEIKQKAVLDMAADRGPFIDQSQSLNLHVTQPTYAKLSSMHFYSWDLGLKTGQYYLRTLAAADAIKFTIDKSVVQGNTLPKHSTIPPAVSSTTSVSRQSGKTAVEKSTDPPALLTNRTIRGALEQKAQESVYPPMGYTKNVPHNINSPATHVLSQPLVCPLRRPGVPYSDNDVCEACSG